MHSVLATKMGQALAESYTKCMKHTRLKATTFKGYGVTGVKIPSSDTIIS